MRDGFFGAGGGLRRHQQNAARAVLALLIGALVALIAIPAGGRFGAFAQTASPTPTETATATPTPTPTSTLPEGPHIEWINPEEGTSTVLSAKQDVDELYHLVAWSFQTPASPAVQFEIHQGAQRTVVGTATQVGLDTWEHHWDLSGLPDGTYDLHAILFSAGTEVARDEIEVEINNEDDGLPLPGDPDDQAVKAALVYPENGQGLGYYTNPNGVSRFVVEGVVSAGTRFVQAFYSTSVPGTDPTWRSCGAASSPSAEPPPGMSAAPEGSLYSRIRCTVNEADDPAAISAVALVPDRTPSPSPEPAPMGLYRGASDGHRVHSYVQVPGDVTIFPPQQQVNAGEGGAFGCSENITATLLDQNGRLITGGKVDVHALGPTDNLRFALNTGGTTGRSPAQPPAGGGHNTESGWNCANNSATGTQGIHVRLDEPDIKHIQTTADGTNVHGQFVFALRSDASGPTQFTAWGDANNDDRFCADEAHGNGSIGWGEGAPEVTGVPADDLGPCPGPTATTSPTTTTTPTTSPTTSPGGDTVQSGPCRGYPHNSTTPREGGGGLVVVGTHGDDLLDGGPGDDIMCGLGGNDTMRGLGGDDSIYGGRGADKIRGGPGDDILVGGGGHDIIRGGGGADVLRGNRGNDTMRGGRGPDTLQGGRGHDTLFGGRGHDTLRGGRGNDALYGGRGNDLLIGGRGNDLCRGGPGDNRMRNCNR